MQVCNQTMQPLFALGKKNKMASKSSSCNVFCFLLILTLHYLPQGLASRKLVDIPQNDSSGNNLDNWQGISGVHGRQLGYTPSRVVHQNVTNSGNGNQTVSNSGNGDQTATNNGNGDQQVTNSGNGEQRATNGGNGIQAASNNGNGSQNVTNSGNGIQAARNSGNEAQNLTNSGNGIQGADYSPEGTDIGSVGNGEINSFKNTTKGGVVNATVGNNGIQVVTKGADGKFHTITINNNGIHQEDQENNSPPTYQGSPFFTPPLHPNEPFYAPPESPSGTP